jgi:hypothetical protein
MRPHGDQTTEEAIELQVRLRGALLCGLLLLFLTAVVPAAGAFADEGNQAGLVVQLADGHVETRCVTFEEDEINGAEMLTHSDLAFVVDPASGMGLIVCQIEDVGCAYPAEPCFCQCMGGGECVYWNYFYREPGGTEWVYSALGAAVHKVKEGSVDAWVWGDGHTPPAGELDFETICMSPTPAPTATSELPTPRPATATDTLTATPAPTDLPAARPTSTTAPPSPSSTSQAAATTAPPTATPSPIPRTSQNLRNYWPFGLMILGLAAAGVIVWFRRR